MDLFLGCTVAHPLLIKNKFSLRVKNKSIAKGSQSQSDVLDIENIIFSCLIRLKFCMHAMLWAKSEDSLKGFFL